MTAPTLPDAPWRHRPGLDRLLAALDAVRGGARFVGGAVRDTLAGMSVKDIDVATPHEPRDVVARLKAADIKAVPTGLDHGTITAVIEGYPVEITTLRRDVSTDGRRATIAFTADWRDDAARRDFTINALYADPLSGEIFDFFGGVADLEVKRVRFIGSATDRIAEDHLRILRYFRFFARFGGAEPDAEAYAACIAQANSLMALSRERIADELMKLLAVPAPVPAIALMIAGGVLQPVVPEIAQPGVERLARLMAREASAGIERAPVRSLGALLPPDAATGEAVAVRLKLSNRARKRIALMLSPSPAHRTAQALAYRIGVEGAIDRLLLGEAPLADIREIVDWRPPIMPVRGTTLIDMGFAPGPDIAAALGLIEEEWIAQGFPDRSALDRIVAQTVSKFQRARQ